ncbi:MAG: HNH endonuclease [Blastocatellia bacterium]
MKRYKQKSKKNGQISGLLRARSRHARIEQVSRLRVIKRDNSTCYMCGRKLGYSEMVLDHIIPLSRGGAHCESNLAVACAPCNLRKGSKLPAECDWLNQSDGTLTIRKSNQA